MAWMSPKLRSWWQKLFAFQLFSGIVRNIHCSHSLIMLLHLRWATYLPTTIKSGLIGTATVLCSPLMKPSPFDVTNIFTSLWLKTRHVWVNEIEDVFKWIFHSFTFARPYVNSRETDVPYGNEMRSTYFLYHAISILIKCYVPENVLDNCLIVQK